MDSESTSAPAVDQQHQQHQQQTSAKTTFTLEDAHDEVDLLLDTNRVTAQQVAAIQHVLKEHVALREKVVKLKSLLGRSAKAQREHKIELDTCRSKLKESTEQVEKLSQKVETLASRPTHMDLLADFESNFDRALLQSARQQQQQQQSGGQDTGAAPSSLEQPAALDTMLLQELSELKTRLDTLESLNTNYKQRSVSLEQECTSLKREREHLQHSLKSLQLELRMARMETEHATRSLQDKTASLKEMQLEIDLVTRASVSASVRAAQGESLVKSKLREEAELAQLRSQVQALQEWACASAEAKSLAMEHVRVLERQLSLYKQQQEDSTSNNERVLWNKHASLVVGAGDVGSKVFELDQEEAATLSKDEHMVLRWKFDVAPSDLDVVFSLLKGNCDSHEKQSRADYIIQNRTVTGGAAGETEAAFDIENACTLLWSNAGSWVRPRTIKYSVDVVALKD
jgi:hypothetical protein